MSSTVAYKRLEITLVQVEYALADFRALTALDYDHLVVEELDKLIEVYTQINRNLLFALCDLENDGKRISRKKAI